MYYLSKLYKVGKNGLIGIGGLAGIGSIAYGIILGHISGLILIIGGSVWVVQTGIILYDNSKLLSTVRKQLVGLELEIEASSKENKRMRDLIDSENKHKERRVTEIDILRAKLLGLNEKIESIEKLKEEYKKSSENLAITNLDLKLEIDNLLSLRGSFDAERRNLKLLLEETKLQLEEVRQKLEEARQKFEEVQQKKELYEMEIMNLQNTVGNQAEKIEDCKEQIADYKEQVTYLTKIYEDSREIILNMAQTSMVFDGISKSLNEGLVKIEENDLQQGQDRKNDQVGYLSRFLSKVSGLVSGMVGGKSATYNQIGENDHSKSDNEDSTRDNDTVLSERADLISKDDLQTLLNMKDPLMEK